MLAWMAYTTLVGALLVAAGVLLDDWVPSIAGRRRMVWLAVIAGTLVLGVAVTNPPAESATAPPNTVIRSETPGEPTASLPTGATTTRARGDAAAHVSAPKLPTAPGQSVTIDVVLLVAWLACSMLCIGVLVMSAWRVSRMRRAWRESVIAGVPVLVSHDVGPAVIGLVHHGIVVPSWVEALREEDQRTVMTHEREHVRAGDPLLLWGATLLVALAPWNVALWYALRRLRHAIEIDCDGRVLRARPDTRAYCTLLLEVGERTLAGVAPIAALAEPATLLERRIDAMTLARTRGWRVIAGMAAAVLLVVAACRAPHPSVAPRERALLLAHELRALLQSDTGAVVLPTAERERLSQALQSTTAPRQPDALARAESLSRASISRRDRLAEASRIVEQEHTARDSALAKSAAAAIELHYPELFNRRDTIAMDVVLIFAPGGALKSHSMKPRGNRKTYSPQDFSTVQVELMRLWPRPELNANVVIVLEAERQLGTTSPRSAGGALTGTLSTTRPANGAMEFGRRVDSLARADFPEAFEKRDDAMVVAVVFDPDLRIVRKARKRFVVDEVFDVVPGSADQPHAMRNSGYLLSRMFGALPNLANSGSHTNADAPKTIFAYALLLEADTRQPELSRDSLLALASRYESTTVHSISNGTRYVVLRLDRTGAVVSHEGIGYAPGATRPSVTVLRQMFFGRDSAIDDDDGRVVLLRAAEPDAIPGPLYAFVVRPRR